QAVGWIGFGDIPHRVITTPRIVVAVAEAVHIVAKRGQAHDILQVMPGHAAHRKADNRAEHDDAQPVLRGQAHEEIFQAPWKPPDVPELFPGRAWSGVRSFRRSPRWLRPLPRRCGRPSTLRRRADDRRTRYPAEPPACRSPGRRNLDR